MLVKFTLEGLPVGKQRARTFYDPRVRKVISKTPAGTVAYEKTIQALAFMHSSITFGHEFWPKDAKYYLLVKVVFGKDKRKWCDIDNVLKTVADGCNGILWKDDKQVDFMQVERFHDDKPRIEVEAGLWPIQLAPDYLRRLLDGGVP